MTISDSVATPVRTDVIELALLADINSSTSTFDVEQPPLPSYPPQQGNFRQLVALIAVFFSAKLLLAITDRWLYPFLLQVSSETSISTTNFTIIISLSQLPCLIAPLVSPMGDYYGFAKVMYISVFVAGIGCFICSILPSWGGIFIGTLVCALGRVCFYPALQSIVGSSVSVNSIGRVTSIVEASWSFASIAGFPIIGVLIDSFGWRAPFICLGILLCLSPIPLRLIIAYSTPVKEICFSIDPAESTESNQVSVSDDDTTSSNSVMSKPNGSDIKQIPLETQKSSMFTVFVKSWSSVGKSSQAWFLVLSFLPMVIGWDASFIAIGSCLEKSYNLSVEDLGLVMMVVGVAELSSDALIIAFGDCIGLRRMALVAIIFSAILPICSFFIGSFSLPAALVYVFLFFMSCETYFICILSIWTGVVPSACVTMLSLFFTTMGIGRTIGSIAGEELYNSHGIQGVAILSISVFSISSLVMRFGVKDPANHVGH